MTIRLRTIAILAVGLFLVASLLLAQEMVTEPSTGKAFPTKITVTSSGTEYALNLTGVAVRKKFVFKVYGMGHYMQDPPASTGEAAFKAILTDGKAKQITMTFVRDVDAGSIQNAYRDGFKENSTKDELKAIQPFIDKFLGSFTSGVKENDVFILRWMPGGTIIPIIQGQEKEAVSNPTFARVLWTIWFGGDSIVDRDDLVSRLAAK
jgi:hypothetical protein